jgi:hypothetical protein
MCLFVMFLAGLWTLRGFAGQSVPLRRQNRLTGCGFAHLRHRVLGYDDRMTKVRRAGLLAAFLAVASMAESQAASVLEDRFTSSSLGSVCR